MKMEAIQRGTNSVPRVNGTRMNKSVVGARLGAAFKLCWDAWIIRQGTVVDSSGIFRRKDKFLSEVTDIYSLMCEAEDRVNEVSQN